eukprot:9113566-Alexandrium_andersonii.AAC.1
MEVYRARASMVHVLCLRLAAHITAACRDRIARVAAVSLTATPPCSSLGAPRSGTRTHPAT